VGVEVGVRMASQTLQAIMISDLTISEESSRTKQVRLGRGTPHHTPKTAKLWQHGVTAEKWRSQSDFSQGALEQAAA